MRSPRGDVAPSSTVTGQRALSSYDVYWAHAWAVTGDLYTDVARSGESDLETRLRREMLFCLLGGHGVTYELNRSAADRLWELGVLGAGVLCATEIHAELTRAQFEPVRRDGSLRRYRFPERKAELLSRASAWVSEHRPLSDLLLEQKNECSRRRVLLQCPGLGPKSASWLLRNVGLAHRLAILDIHVLRTMRACGRIGALRLPEHYELAEREFLTWCEELGVRPAGFDLLVWDWSRRRPHG